MADNQVQSGGSSAPSGGMTIKKFVCEAVGTLGLTLVACGTAVATDCEVAPTALAFGFVIFAMAYSIGSISGCHINPAVSLCMLIRKKMSAVEFGGYVGAQVLGAIVGSILLGLCLRGKYEVLGGNKIQPYLKSENDKKDGWAYVDALLVEIILTFYFTLAVQGATDTKYHDGKHAGVVIGLSLALVHGLGLKLTGTSVNPARSLAPAIIEAIAGETEAIEQIWIFIVGPFAGGAISAVVYGALA